MTRIAEGSARRRRTRKERARLKREFRARRRKQGIVFALMVLYYILVTTCLAWFPHGSLAALAIVLLYLLPVYPVLRFSVRNQRCPRCNGTFLGNQLYAPLYRRFPPICPHCGADFR